MRKFGSKAIAAGIVLAWAGVAGAKELTWVGNVNNTWDKSTANWNDGSAAVAFANGDEVTVAKGSILSLGCNVEPSAVVFNLASDLSMLLNGKNLTNVTSFEKRGAGTLTITASNCSAGLAFYGPIDIKEGAIKLMGSNDHYAFSHIGSKQGTEYIVRDGAKLIVGERNSLGKADKLGGSAATVRVKTGGTFEFAKDGSSGTHNSISNLFLEGGTLALNGIGGSGIGYFAILDTLSFSGNTPYTINIGLANPGISLPPGSPARFDVADITGDENEDVTINIPLTKATNWQQPTSSDKITDGKHGLIKSGAGRLKITVAANINGGLTVEGGVLEFTQQSALNGEYDQTITVKTNATLRYSIRNALSCYTTNGYVNTKYVIDHGTFLIDDPDKVHGHTYLGEEMTLDNATFKTTIDGYGSGWNELGAFTLGSLISFKGEKVYDISPFSEMANARMHLSANPHTEIRVADITGDAAVDVTNGYTLCDRCVLTNNAYFKSLDPGGFIKTGAGTLAHTAKGTYRGDVEIREGTLLLDKPGFAWNDFGNGSSSFLGDVTQTSRTITVSEGGTLAFAQRNMLDSYSYGDDGHNAVQSQLVLNGGTLKFVGSNAANVFGSITVNGGTFDYTEAAAWGLFNFRGTFKVTGSKAVVLPRPTSGTGRAIIALYPLYASVFDVEDVTGDEKVDLDLNLALTKPPDPTFYNGTQTNSSTKLPYIYQYGFVKQGAGTMALNPVTVDTPYFDDEARINAGTILVNDNLASAGTFVIAAGAAIGGTGTVHAVTLAEGVRLVATAGQSKALTVAGNLALPQTGTIDITIPSGVDPKKIKVRVAKSTGTLTGAANLANWSLRINGGTASSDYLLTVVNGEIRVTYPHGMLMLIK